MKSLILLSRPGCERCEIWEDELHRHFRGKYHLDWRDVDRDASLQQLYGHLIPVLLRNNGESLCIESLDLGLIAKYLSKGTV